MAADSAATLSRHGTKLLAAKVKEFSLDLRVTPSLCRLFPTRMKLLLVVAAAAAVLAVASCARMSLEDMEFHAWKLKFCECVLTEQI